MMLSITYLLLHYVPFGGALWWGSSSDNSRDDSRETTLYGVPARLAS
ncbi:hypothetical protein [Frankia sp. CcWB3]